eukprot:CAMPEP_0116063840 /NCGR_PEP_ID=MMETSP0322-20121206/8696_1 /TAXON_ID=163516 /ORGANISM="Leptocylindrus danicus var. apora, Strain B651" /LENGTH=182 /DNA_ID=CAMNT_0003549619 /DNA_START=288 /DNA_END=836 /DNA_ORIENTATION=+
MKDSSTRSSSHAAVLLAATAAFLMLPRTESAAAASFCTSSHSIVRHAGKRQPLHATSWTHHRHGSSSSGLKMYVPSSSSSASTQSTPATASSSLHATVNNYHAESSTVPSDTLPQFKTAHGLLSPRTVKILEDNCRNGMLSDELDYFLTTYREYGPMACLPMLSDSKILPELTKAMRDSVSS